MPERSLVADTPAQAAFAQALVNAVESPMPRRFKVFPNFADRLSSFGSLLTLQVRCSIDFALQRPNQSWLSSRKAA